MNKRSDNHLPFLLLLGLISIYLLWGVSRVPFHPDESTQLFMSADFETLLQDPASLSWKPSGKPNPTERYRLLDAPLTRFLLGFSRWIVQIPPLMVDWDWSKSWQENVDKGALPSPDLLEHARWTITILLPVSLICLYLTGRALNSNRTGLFSALFLGTSSLTLLHGRRAMAEGPLILGITFFLWSLCQVERRPWLTGLAAAVAFNAKQSAAALFFAGLVVILLCILKKPEHRPRFWLMLGQYMGVFMISALVLNPVLWSNPVGGLQAVWKTRQAIVKQQIADTLDQAPEKVLNSPPDRTIIMIANLYITPPAFADVGNYSTATRAMELRYLAVPGHNLLRGFIGGGILLSLTLIGMIMGMLNLIRRREKDFPLLLPLMVVTVLQATALVIAIPLPIQRYVVPLLPICCLWMAYGIEPFLLILQESLVQLRKTRDSYDLSRTSDRSGAISK